MHFKPEVDMPVDQAVRFYLLEKVCDFEATAAHLTDSDRLLVVESVHDLRVICRQVLSVFDAFGPFICISHMKPLRRQIREINRLLGPVRDLDVLLELPDLLSPDRERVEHDRRYALSSLITECTGRNFANRLTRMKEPLAISTGQSANHTLGPVVPEVLYRLAAEIVAFRPTLFDQVPPRLTDDCPFSSEHADESIHQLRIACKRFRYTLAFLKPLFSPDADEALRSFKELQDLLGAWHDLYLLIHFVGSLSESSSVSLEPVRKRQKELLVKFDFIWQSLDAEWFHRLICQLVDSMYVAPDIDPQTDSSRHKP